MWPVSDSASHRDRPVDLSDAHQLPAGYRFAPRPSASLASSASGPSWRGRPRLQQPLRLVRARQLQRLHRPRQPPGGRVRLLLPAGQHPPQPGPRLVRLRVRQGLPQPPDRDLAAGRGQLLLGRLPDPELRAVQVGHPLVELLPAHRQFGRLHPLGEQLDRGRRVADQGPLGRYAFAASSEARASHRPSVGQVLRAKVPQDRGQVGVRDQARGRPA